MNYFKDNASWIVPSVIALLALVAAVWSSVSSHASKNEARLSREASQRSAEASERSATAAEESARADLEQAALARAEREEADAAARRRPWRFTALSKTKYRVVNHGVTAFNVVAQAPDMRIIVEAGVRGLAAVQPGESFELFVVKGMGQSGDVAITWAETDEEEAPRLAQHELL